MHGMFPGQKSEKGELNPKAGTSSYLTFFTKAEASAVADFLKPGLGTHSHTVGSNNVRVYHPGDEDHMKLNQVLKQQGMKELHDEDCCNGKHGGGGQMGGGVGVGIGGGMMGGAFEEDAKRLDDIMDQDGGGGFF